MSRALVTLRNALGAFAVLCSMLAVLLVCGAPAQGRVIHPYTGQSFGPHGVGAGSFPKLIGLTVDQGTGDLFVYDAGEEGSVYKFDSSGAPVNFSSSATNVITGVGSTNGSEAEIAVDSSSGPDAGDIYVANNKVVKIYGASGTFLGELTGGETCGVAVDPAGAVYVGVYPETVRKYVPSSNPVSNSDQTSSMGGLSAVCNVAADSEGNVYAARYFGGIFRFDALQFGSLSATGTTLDESGRTLAVDPSDDHVYVNEVSDVAEYDPSGKLLNVSGAVDLSGSFGMAVRGGELYAPADGRVKIFGPAAFLAEVLTGPAKEVTDTSAKVAGSINPEGLATTYQFEYGTSTEYGSKSPVSPGSVGSDSSTHELEASLSGLAPSTVYHYRLAAINENGVNLGADQTLRTTGSPTIDGEFTGQIGQTEATVEASINPGGFDTHYQVEYGLTTSYGSITAPVDIGSETNDQSASANLTSLKVGSVYHYRFVATNSQGAPVDGPDKTFTTVPAARVLNESISNAGTTSVTFQANVIVFGNLSSYYYEYGPTDAYGLTTQTASLGAPNGSVGALAQVSGLQPGTAYHFRIVVTNQDGTIQGEDAKFSTLPPGVLGLPDGRGYEMVTPVDNEGIELYAPYGAGVEGEEAVGTKYPVRAAADGHAVAYVGEPTAEGNGNQGNGKGNEFIAARSFSGGWVQHDVQPPGFASPRYIAFSTDLSTGVLLSTEPLSAGVADKYETLYTRSSATGTLQPLSRVTPPNRPPNIGIEGFGTANAEGIPSEKNLGTFYAGASQDSKHLFFEANDALTQDAVDGGEHENNLYESVEGALRLVNILPNGHAEPNASYGVPPTGEKEEENTTHVISADGSRVFWTDLNTGSLYVRENGTSTTLVAEEATFQAASVDGSRVLYTKSGDLYEDDLSSGVRTDLAPAGQVLGIAGSSDDASYVYFVAEGSLAPGATAGQPNLYLHHSGVTTLIATLGAEVEEDPGYLYGGGQWNDWRPSPGRRTAQSTPDGHALVFMSRQSLTGSDNHTETGEASFEVYVYDASTGNLSCASCTSSGERPGSVLGGYLPITGETGTYQLRSISEDGGRVFFQSSIPLVAQDVNGRRDVYEWERTGEGSCHLPGGCVYLLSGGLSQGGSYFIDASADGSDVFFITRQKLVGQDQNELYDIYDARIGAEVPPTPSQCTGSGCQGVPAPPPIFATPSSVTFNGVGNLSAPAKSSAKPKAKAKAKHKKKKHKKVKQKSKRHSKKATTKKSKSGVRRTGRQ